MKRLYKVIAASLATLMATALGGILTTDKTPLIEVAADVDPTQLVNGNFETGDLTGWSGDNIGGVIATSNTFWSGREYYATGSYFFNGFESEGNTGTLTSQTFTLGGDGYISLLIGGGANTSTTYISVMNATDEPDTEVLRITNTGFQDPARVLNLHFQWHQVNEDYLGDTLYLVVNDQATGGFGALTLDDIRVSQTAEQVIASYWAHKEFVGTNTDTSAHGIRDLYTTFAYPDTSVSGNHITNPSFETGDLTGWTSLSVPNTGSAISSATHFWVENIPYNNEGTYHFNGWGAQSTETDMFGIRSSTFTLGGAGYISWRMGGRNAAMKVFLSGGTEVAYITNTAFADINFPRVENGSRLATMTTFVADLRAFLGETLYIELFETDANASWGTGFYDDVVTYYPLAPQTSLNYDIVSQVYDTYSNTDIHIAHVSGSNVSTHGDPASDFILAFRELRDEEGSICGVLSDSTDYDNLKTTYSGLSTEAKAIVDNTKDVVGESYTIANTMAYLDERLGYGSGGGEALITITNSPINQTTSILFMAFVAIIVIAAPALFVVRKRKTNH